MHIYAFGSLCRGEVSSDSDIDLLAVTNGHDERFDPALYSIYSYERLIEIWLEGNPFAWHLHLEAKLLYAESDGDFLESLGAPAKYRKAQQDCQRFMALLDSSIAAIRTGTNSTTFELSTVFLAIRNFATCYSLGVRQEANFSRRSALHLGPDSLHVSSSTYSVLERARVLCTRGIGKLISINEQELAINEVGMARRWMLELMEKVENNA